VEEAFRKASYVEVDGEKLPLYMNPPVIKKLEVFGRPLAGCPLVSSMMCEFCTPSAFRLTWYQQALAGGEPAGPSLGEGRVLNVPEDITGKTLCLRADVAESKNCDRPKHILRVGLVEKAPDGWPQRRWEAFGARPAGAIRVLTYNILAPVYARSQLAVKDLFPYCPPECLDYGYRQPLIGREILSINADLIFLQECTHATFRKFLIPLFGELFHGRVTLKASRTSEGCVTLARKSMFEVLEEHDFLFRKLLRSSSAFRPILCELRAKWPDFIQGILPHMTTIFQIALIKHTETGDLLVVANTHLFWHPMARHIRLLQAITMLHEVQELRKKHASAQGLPRVILCGDLNCMPETGVRQLLTVGEIPSTHPDWEHAKHFFWQNDEPAEQGEADEDDGDEVPAGVSGSVPSLEADPDDEVIPLPRDQWQPGHGVTLKNPLGKMNDAYAAAPLPFTNYVKDFKSTLDYILTSGDVRVLKTLPGATEEDIQQGEGLPCALHPSDHLSIAADLELTSR